MALASYLAVYIAGAVRLALESDPGVLVGGSRLVDGVGLLKRRPASHDYAGEAKAVTKGEWPDRVAKFKRLFGSAPAALEAAVGELDWMRRTRNGVGHAFGRNVDAYRERMVVRPAPLQSLSTDRLQKLMSLVDNVAAEIDSFLLVHHIGEFEPALLWHQCRAQLWARQEYADLFGRILRDRTGHTYGRQFCKSLVRFYERA